MQVPQAFLILLVNRIFVCICKVPKGIQKKGLSTLCVEALFYSCAEKTMITIFYSAEAGFTQIGDDQARS
jgi:hypothetical protein